MGLGARADVPDRDEADRAVDMVAFFGRAGRRGNRQAASTPSSVTCAAANGDERPDVSPGKPRRVVVAVPPARPVDQTTSSRPIFVRQCARLAASEAAWSREPRSSSRPRARCRRAPWPSRPRRVGEDVDLRDPRRRNCPQRPIERHLVLTRKADDHVAREVEALGPRDPLEVRAGRVAPAHRAQHRVVAGLRGRASAETRPRLPQRVEQVVAQVIDLDRREAQTAEPVDLARFADEPRQRVSGFASRKQPRLIPVSTTSRWPCATRRRISRAPPSRCDCATLRAPGGSRRRHRRSCNRPGPGRTHARGRGAPAPGAADRPTLPATNSGVSSLGRDDHDDSIGRPATRASRFARTRSRRRGRAFARARGRLARLPGPPRASRSTCSRPRHRRRLDLLVSVADQALPERLGVGIRDLAAQEPDRECRHRRRTLTLPDGEIGRPARPGSAPDARNPPQFGRLPTR